MWPFKPKSNAKKQPVLSSDEGLDPFAALGSRITIVERELADLDARYRRLRALQAADASREARQPPDAFVEASEAPAALPGGKAAFRVRVLKGLNTKHAMLTRHPPEEAA